MTHTKTKEIELVASEVTLSSCMPDNSKALDVAVTAWCGGRVFAAGKVTLLPAVDGKGGYTSWGDCADNWVEGGLLINMVVTAAETGNDLRDTLGRLALVAGTAADEFEFPAPAPEPAPESECEICGDSAKLMPDDESEMDVCENCYHDHCS